MAGNSTIKQKIGKCLDCPADAPEKPLTAGRCSIHYWPHRNEVNKDKTHNKAKAAEKKSMAVYMASQLLLIPGYCENQCGTRLTKQGPGGYKTHICHILPKAYYKSVAEHPQNRWFGCGDCHTDYDKKGAERHPGLPVAPLIKERFLQFMDELTPKEVGRMAKEFPWLHKIYIEHDRGGAQ